MYRTIDLLDLFDNLLCKFS